MADLEDMGLLYAPHTSAGRLPTELGLRLFEAGHESIYVRRSYGRGLMPAELLAHATAVPFLASNRLVIVEGLLRALGDARSGRRRKKGDTDDPLEAWRAAAAQLADPAAMPATTTGRMTTVCTTDSSYFTSSLVSM